MANYNFNTTARPCPAATLADEAQKLIAAHIAVDEHVADHMRKSDLLVTTTDFLDAVMRRASYVRTDSARGALFQICAISHHLADLNDVIMSEVDARTPPASKAIERLLHSLIGFIEEATDARMADACGDWFMTKWASEHGRLDEALAIQKKASDLSSQVATKPKGGSH